MAAGIPSLTPLWDWIVPFQHPGAYAAGLYPATPSGLVWLRPKATSGLCVFLRGGDGGRLLVAKQFIQCKQIFFPNYLEFG